MVHRPSFEPEECIALREEDGAREYNLIYTPPTATSGLPCLKMLRKMTTKTRTVR